MPTSADEGKTIYTQWLTENKPARILDVGPGAGAYADLTLDVYTPDVLDAVEIFPRYIDDYGLNEKYSEIFIGNFLDIAPTLETYDLVILGDVIEHFVDEEALRCWDLARTVAGPSGTIICSTPIIEYPQGTEFGNVHEAHLSLFPEDRLRSLPGVYYVWGGSLIGVALAKGE